MRVRKKPLGGEVIYAGDANLSDEQIAKLPFDLYRQGYEHYWKTHEHPDATFKYTMSSLLELMNFDAATNMDLISQLLLMIAESKADSLYMSESAFKEAANTKEKELFCLRVPLTSKLIGCHSTLIKPRKS